MARKGITQSVALDTREYVRGVQKGIIEPLEETVEAIDRVQQAGDAAGEQLEAAFDAARKEVSDFKKAQTEAGKEFQRLTREARSSGNSMGRSIRDGAEDAEKGLNEFRDEANSTAKEAAASFDGSAESIVDAFQEVAANAFAGFGPAGVLAGLAVAGGIGLAVAAFQDGQKDAEAMRERVAELTGELIRAGSDGAPSIQFLVDKLRELATASEDGQVNLDKLAEAATGSKLDFRALAQTYAGSTENLDELITKAKQSKKALEDEAEAIDTTTNAGTARYRGLLDQSAATDQYIGYLEGAAAAAQEAAENEANFIKAGGPEIEAKAAAIQAIDAAYDETAGSVENYINQETGVFDVTGYLKAMAEREKALRNYQTTLLSSGLSPEAKVFLNSQGAEVAAQMLAGYKSAAPAQQAELARYWTEAGKSSSGQFQRAAVGALPDRIDKTPSVSLKADTKPAERDVNRFIESNAGRTVTVTVIGRDRQGRPIF